MEATILFVAVAALILLAVTSMRYGVDSRDGFTAKEREPAAGGIVSEGPIAAQARPKTSLARLNMDVPEHERAQSNVCVPAPCGV